MRRKVLLISLFAVMLAAPSGGCGRRGPLEPPPGTPPEPARAAEDKAVERANGGRVAIMPLQNDKPEEDYAFDRDRTPLPASQVVGKRQPFFLDPLLSDK